MPTGRSDAIIGNGLPAVYGLAHGGKTLFWTASDLYFVFYMNEVCGIAPAITGLIVGGSILVAALADLMTGRLFKAQVRDAVQAGRLQLAGAIISSLALLLFAATAFVSSELRIASCIVTLMFFRIAYAVVDIPQNALLSLAARYDETKTALVAIRNAAGGLARIALALAFLPTLAVAPPIVAASRFVWLALAMAVVGTMGAVLLARHVATHSDVPAAEGTDRRIRTGRHYLRMSIASAALTAFMQLEPYLATRVIADRWIGSIFMVAVAAGAILSQPAWRWLALNAPARLWPSALMAIAVAGALMLGLPIEKANGAGAAGAFYGLASGGLLFALWTAFARDIGGLHAFGAYARFTAAAKVGQALAIVSVGVLLQNVSASPAATWSFNPAGWMALALLAGAAMLSRMP